MKKLVVIVLGLILYSTTWGQGFLRGSVIDKVTGEYIPTATIKFKIKKTDKLVVSNMEGLFMMKDIPEGIYDVECMAAGYQTQRIEGILIKDDRTKLAYFKLNRGNPQDVDVVLTYASLKATLNTKVTTATKTEKSLANAPATIYVVTSRDIEERGYMSLDEVLQDIPEIEIQNKADAELYNLISVRGLFGNEKLLILRDGVRVNSMATTSHVVDKNFSVRNAERIEVVLGPASALYGADAFSGVVNIITKEGKQLRGGHLTASYGMYHTTDNAFAIGGGDSKISFMVDGSFYRSNEPNLARAYSSDFQWYNDTYLTDTILSGLSNDSVSIATMYPYQNQRRAYSLQGKLKVYDFELGVVRSEEIHASATGLQGKYAPYTNKAEFGVALTNVYLSHNLKDTDQRWSLNSLVSWNHFEINPKSSFINAFSSYDNAHKYGYDNNLKVRETFSFNINEKHGLRAGLSYQYTNSLPKTSDLPFPYKRFTKPDEQGLYYIGTEGEGIPQDFYTFTQHNIGSFLQYQGNIADILLITAGLRYDYNTRYNKQKNKQFNALDPLNPRVGLIVRPVEQFRIKAFYGEAFLAPSTKKTFEHYGSVVPGFVVGSHHNYGSFFWHVPNSTLKPEKIRTVEGGASFIDEHFAIQANGFFNIASNLVENSYDFNQTFVTQSQDSIFILVTEQSDNNASAQTYGGTLRFDYRQTFGEEDQTELNVFAAYTYMNGRINDSLKLGFTAAHTIKGGLTFRYKRFSLNLRALFRSASIIADETYTTINAPNNGNGAFVVLNAYAKYKIYDAKGWDVDLFVKANNVTNQRYYNTTINNQIYFGAAPQDPVRILGGISCKLQPSFKRKTVVKKPEKSKSLKEENLNNGTRF
ncbi:MAG: TonB-dependent receptor [Aureispira sp.]|nr:TonB-dependent receptor [Aureispira sp.]